MCEYDYDDEMDIDLGLEWYMPSPAEELQEAKDLAFAAGYDNPYDNAKQKAKEYAERFLGSVYETASSDDKALIIEQYHLGHAQAAAERQESESHEESDRLDGDEYLDLLDDQQLKQLY